MRTRFDNSKVWVAADHREIKIADMETSHLLNTVRMLLNRPYSIASMLIKDVESTSQDYCPEVWTPTHQGASSVVKQSVHAITSMTRDELIEYAMNSPLGSALVDELKDRGVNIDNLINLWISEEDGA